MGNKRVCFKGELNLDKLLELSFRSIICILNGEGIKANIYKNKALEVYEEINFRDKCIYKIEDHIPKHIKNKVYEMVS